MKKLTAVVGSLIFLGATLITTPVAAVEVEYVESPVLTGGRYRAKDICIHQTFTSSAWSPGDIGNSFEPAVVTGWRSASQTCSGYYDWQVLRVSLYSAADGHCTKWTGTANPASYYVGHPMNQWYNRVWDGSVIPEVWINQYYNNTCWDTYFEQDNRLGREMANVLGLKPHCSWIAGAEAVANACGNPPFQANANDRNRITQLMNP